VPKDFDQALKLATMCPVQVYAKTGATYTIAFLPLDMVRTGVTQAQLDRAKAMLPDLEEVTSITP
jgi:hypothetical protein